jgi:hypothetical protein
VAAVSKPPTPQAISALLRKAGFERWTLGPATREHWDGRPVASSRERSDGYEVIKGPREQVLVGYREGRVVNPDRMAERRARMLAEYARVVRDAGWQVADSESGEWAPGLIVTAREEAPMTDYRIEFAIQRRSPGDDDFTEIGFGSSGSAGSVDDAAYAVESLVQHRQWETAPGMPDPDSVDREDAP